MVYPRCRDFLLITLCATTVQSVAAQTLRILNWEDYLADEVIAAWEQQSGWQVEQVFYDNEAERDLILANKAVRNIDLVVIGDEIIQRMGKAGYLAPLTEQYVEGLAPIWQGSCGDYGSPYLWGSLGIAYRTDKVDQAPANWKDLLYPIGAWQNHIGMIGQYDELLGPAMLAMSLDPMSNDEGHLKRAFELLKRQSESVLTYEYAPSYLSVATPEEQEELWVTQVYSGDEYTLNDLYGSQVWQYVLPEDGVLLWLDCLAVVASSSNQQAAQEFIQFLGKSAINALDSESVGVATPSLTAKSLQSEEFASDQVTYPPADVLAKARRYKPLDSENIRLRTQIKDALIRYHDSK
ncbi:spermidine/putrescine ABC transporter substrate-binding protein [Maribrevibacterium harenarium]|uniref:Spermidine/putrescine ABC transporter substrate-binding protein n=1 Tax=Maribrevibacterium harenarium TaxID=2589817 RepID=A0A501WJC6_9GAMM|nr:spermidine/putrescine ABC transporter substrate-binding protein [Maribrevibacterium harenarium]TPE48460.1 spermidine/putrescine ABC transporter substrate-binding protein [Maribrevibacterium harenarium]